jgi:TetR/AcrR family transcriptional regulator, ethionamide resistance regulator
VTVIGHDVKTICPDTVSAQYVGLACGMASVTRSAQADRQDRRQAMERRLFEATERLVGDGASFTELSVERLASTAGISRSTFYVHFHDKGDLVRKLATTVLTELRDVSSGWWDVAEHAVPADLTASLAAIMDIYRRRAAAFTTIVETATYDPSVADELRTLMQSIIDATRTAIERGQAAGVMRQVSPAETAAVLTWMVERAGYQLIRGSEPANDQKIVEVLTDIIWTALYRASP